MEPTDQIAAGNDTPIRPAALNRTLVRIILVMSVAGMAYLFTEASGPQERENLIDVSVSNAVVELVLKTEYRVEIEEFFDERFHVHIDVPTVNGASFRGAGLWDVRPDVSIPTVVIDDPQHDVEFIFVFTYAMLDEWSSSLFLDRAVRLELEHEESFAVVSANDGREVVIWRSGDDIYLAVALHGAGRLIPRIPS